MFILIDVFSTFVHLVLNFQNVYFGFAPLKSIHFSPYFLNFKTHYIWSGNHLIHISDYILINLVNKVLS